MVARPIDGAEGYKIFRRHNAEIELDEINEYLRGIGLRSVSPRMLMHYRRLYRHGFDAYLPINRLDIAIAGEDAWSDELQARYHEVAQPVSAQLIYDAELTEVLVESIGTSTATVLGHAPPVQSAIVLRLDATGIERAGRVIRNDPVTSRFHVAFDPYTSVPLEPEDAATTAGLRFHLPAGAHNLNAVADILLTLDRFLARTNPDRDVLIRLRSFSMNSPLDLVISGSQELLTVLGILGGMVLIRKQWYEGTKSKYEAQGIRLDTEQRRASAQAETDAEIVDALSEEVNAQDPAILGQLTQEGPALGAPSSTERRALADAAKAATDLPVELVIEIHPMTDPE